MRTSNKILLALFLAPIVVLSSIHLALYTQYKSGHYVSIQMLTEDEFTRHHFKNIRYVEASGLNRFRIIPADSLVLNIEKQGYINVRFSVVGDRLLIQGDSVVTDTRRGQDKQTDTARSSREVTIYLPSMEKITIYNSDAALKVDEDSTTAKSYNLELGRQTVFHIDEHVDNDSVRKYINSLSVRATTGSIIESFNANTNIKELNLTLTGSHFDDKSCYIGKFLLDADKESTVVLTGENLNKVNKGR